VREPERAVGVPARERVVGVRAADFLAAGIEGLLIPRLS
jgi:hypothetical protein